MCSVCAKLLFVILVRQVLLRFLNGAMTDNWLGNGHAGKHGAVS